jgi:hypothetical protein
MGERLGAGEAAVVAIIEDTTVESATNGLKGYRTLFRRSLDPRIVEASTQSTDEGP